MAAKTALLLANPDWTPVFTLIVFSSVVGLFVGLIRCLVDDRPPDWSWWVPAKTIASSIFISVVVYLLIDDFEIGLKMQISLTAICAFVANDFIVGIKTVSVMIAKDPLAFIRTVRAMIAGKAPTP